MNGFRQIVIGLCVIGLGVSQAQAQALTGEEIMQQAFTRNDGSDSSSSVTMVLIDKNASKRERALQIWVKDYDDLQKRFLRFTEPADISGTSFLSWEHLDQDDTQYLYLPALRRARRIVSSQKKIRFVNTDYTYEDMQRRRPEKDAHKRLTRGLCHGRMCYIVESTPIDQKSSQYRRRVNWVAEDSFVVLRTDFFGKKNSLIKRFDVELLEIHDGIWTPMKTRMHDFVDNHTTLITVTEIHYNRGIDDEQFSLRALETEH